MLFLARHWNGIYDDGMKYIEISRMVNFSKKLFTGKLLLANQLKIFVNIQQNLFNNLGVHKNAELEWNDEQGYELKNSCAIIFKDKYMIYGGYGRGNTVVNYVTRYFDILFIYNQWV